MAFWDKLRGELIDIVEWLDDTRDTMVYRFQRYENEIKYGAKLIVRESQVAAFINEGRLADLFHPGTYTLETKNLPLLSTLQGWKYGFESPFKAEVYFVSTRTFSGHKWGTKNPIMLRDPEFGPVRLRAFGSYGLRVSDPAAFIRQFVGTDQRFTVEELGDQLRDLVVARFADILGESKLPVLDMASNQDELGKFVTDRIHDDFSQFGLEIVSLVVENVSLPPEVEQAMDKRTSMGVIGNLNAYSQYQAANAMEEAAKNPAGGLAAGGLGVGMGYAMANQIGQSLQSGPTGAPQTPPPLPTNVQYYAAINNQQAGPFDMAQLQEMVKAGQLARQTLVWKSGMPQWTAAEKVVELAPVFTQVPPPLPK
ncbi:MAG TPA: SPFH domain-containing protein [Tepidisphaeraceae bacterium]|nr:SPFH domain-containing protein [Tepidisphaeraceae bacterium]